MKKYSDMSREQLLKKAVNFLQKVATGDHLFDGHDKNKYYQLMLFCQNELTSGDIGWKYDPHSLRNLWNRLEAHLHDAHKEEYFPGIVFIHECKTCQEQSMSLFNRALDLWVEAINKEYSIEI